MKNDKSAGWHRRHSIGFGVPPVIRMEEEEDGVGGSSSGPMYGALLSQADSSGALMALISERERIIDLLGENKIDKAQALALLADNRQILLSMQGRSRFGFATEKVIYALLTFSAGVIALLAYLNTTGKLPTDVTMTFVGTVVGGTLTTIAQKLGKVGR